MPIRDGANPHILPRRRNGQRTNAPQFLGIADGTAVRTEVAEALAAAPSLNAGSIIFDVTQSRLAGRLDGIGDPMRLTAMCGFLEATAGFASGIMAAPWSFHGLPHLLRAKELLWVQPFRRTRSAVGRSN